MVIIEAYHSCQIQKKILFNAFCQGQRNIQRIYCGSSVWISKQRVKYWSYILHSRKKNLAYNEAVYRLFINFKKTYDSVTSKVLYNILNLFRIPVKMVRLIRMWLMETDSRVQVGKHLCGIFTVMNILMLDALSPLLCNFALEHSIKTFQVKQDGLKLNGTHNLSVFWWCLYIGRKRTCYYGKNRSFNSC